MSTNAASKIITHGLGPGNKACEGLITTHFSLYCIEITIKPGGGGGPYPGSAWNKIDNINDFYTPVPDHYDPNNTYKVKKQVIITVKLGNINVEKIYLVPINRTKIIINVLNLLNITKERINISVKNIKKILHNISVSISNIRRR